MKCAIAIICHSFSPDEQRLIYLRIKQAVPAMTLILLGTPVADAPAALLAAVRAALNTPTQFESD